MGFNSHRSNSLLASTMLLIYISVNNISRAVHYAQPLQDALVVHVHEDAATHVRSYTLKLHRSSLATGCCALRAKYVGPSALPRKPAPKDSRAILRGPQVIRGKTLTRT